MSDIRDRIKNIADIQQIDSRNLTVVDSTKSEELIEMERIVKDVINLIRFNNPHVATAYSPEDVLHFIESQSRNYLSLFGLELCKRVADPILTMTRTPFTKTSNFLDFYQLCVAQKIRDGELNRGAAENNDINKPAIDIKNGSISDEIKSRGLKNYLRSAFKRP